MPLLERSRGGPAVR